MIERIKTLKVKFPNIQDVINASKLTEEELATANYSGTSSLLIGARASIRKELVANIFNTRLDGSKWVPDWNTNEPKWTPYFNMRANTSSGVGFSGSHYGTWVTLTVCGSRFAFEEEILSDLSTELYPELYVESLTK